MKQLKKALGNLITFFVLWAVFIPLMVIMVGILINTWLESVNNILHIGEFWWISLVLIIGACVAVGMMDFILGERYKKDEP